MLPEYSRVPENLDIVGIPTAGWATMQDPSEMYNYLEQRRLLTARSNADALLWAMLDATPPPIYQESIWGTDTPPAWGLPRVQPEQLRTATYAAIAAGFRGICFRADSGLTKAQGRPNMIEMAFLNEEIDLLEPILGDPDKAIRMMETYLPDPPPQPPATLFQMNSGTANRPPTPKELPPHPTIRAAAITTKDRRGTLLMLADFARDDDRPGSPAASSGPPIKSTRQVRPVPAPAVGRQQGQADRPGRRRRARLPDQPRRRPGPGVEARAGRPPHLPRGLRRHRDRPGHDQRRAQGPDRASINADRPFASTSPSSRPSSSSPGSPRSTRCSRTAATPRRTPPAC